MSFTRDRAAADHRWSSSAVLGIVSLREKKLWYVMSAFPALALLSAPGPRETGPRAADARAHRARRVRARRRSRVRCWRCTPLGQRAAPPARSHAHGARRALDGAGVAAASRSLGGNYWTVAHQFVFHSDRTLEQGDGEAATVMHRPRRRRLGAGGARPSQRAHRPSAAARYVPVVASGKWALVHVAPAPDVRLDAEYARAAPRDQARPGALARGRALTFLARLLLCQPLVALRVLSTSMRTLVSPSCLKPSRFATAGVTSMTRSACRALRSLMRTTTRRPLLRLVTRTRVPSGRCGVRRPCPWDRTTAPLAVRRCRNPGPYHDA